MHHSYTTTKQLKCNGEIPTGILNAGQINKTTTLPLPTEEEWRKDASYHPDIGYINIILSSLEETHIEPK